jgi:AcrR family transcriptional regulator
MSRPRTLEETAALNAALQSFWQHGYEGAWMELLAEAMGMNNTSIYRVFGSKQELFERVREVYHREYLGFRIDALNQATPKMIASRLLHGMVSLHAEEEAPAGCLETNGALAIGPEKETTGRGCLKVGTLYETC